MLTSIFILVLNNGQSYEDYDHWNAGIYKSVEDAHNYAKTSDFWKNGCVVEEWNIKGFVKNHELNQ
jgi:hypothetical protein